MEILKYRGTDVSTFNLSYWRLSGMGVHTSGVTESHLIIVKHVCGAHSSIVPWLRALRASLSRWIILKVNRLPLVFSTFKCSR